MSTIKTAISHTSHVQFHQLSSPHYIDAVRGGVFRLFDSKKTKSKQKWNSRKEKKQKSQELTPPSLEEDRFIWLRVRIA